MTSCCSPTSFPTGYHGAELARVGPGNTVAVFGAGPVGLLAAYSAMLRGAAEVYVVDGVAERLAKAEGIGAIAIDSTRASRASKSTQSAARTRSVLEGCARAKRRCRA